MAANTYLNVKELAKLDSIGSYNDDAAEYADDIDALIAADTKNAGWYSWMEKLDLDELTKEDFGEYLYDYQDHEPFCDDEIGEY